jgi:CRISPR-associated protein Cpf1
LKKYPSSSENWDKTFNFNFTDTNKFESIDQFYAEVEKQGYKIDFVAINK